MVELARIMARCLSCGAEGPDYCTAPAGDGCSFYSRLIAELEARAEKAEALWAEALEAIGQEHAIVETLSAEIARLRAAGTFNQGIDAAVAHMTSTVGNDHGLRARLRRPENEGGG